MPGNQINTRTASIKSKIAVLIHDQLLQESSIRNEVENGVIIHSKRNYLDQPLRLIGEGNSNGDNQQGHTCNLDQVTTRLSKYSVMTVQCM